MTRMVAAGAVVGLLLITPAAYGGHGHVCRELNDVVGDRICGRYGDRWSTERSVPLFIGLGAFNGVVQPAMINAGAAAISDTSLRSYGAAVRAGGMVSPFAYVGVEWALGFGRAPRRDANEVTAGSALFGQGWGAVVAGARVPLGRISLRLELATGAQLLTVSSDDRRPASATRIAVLAQPRAAIDWWVTPDTTVSGWLGTDAVWPGNYTFGIAATVHARAFDGAARW